MKLFPKYVAKLLPDGSYNTPHAHCSDVAAIALVVAQLQDDATIDSIACGLGVNRKSAIAWIAYLAGLHDVMKLSYAFQLMNGILTKYQELNPNTDISKIRQNIHDFCLQRGYYFIPAPNCKNSSISPVQHAHLLPAKLPALLTEATGITKEVAVALTIAPSGHHSCYPTEDITYDVFDYFDDPDHCEGDFDAARLDLAQRLWSNLSFDGCELPFKCTTKASILIAGLIQRADHIGSRPHCFPMQNGDCRPWEETVAMANKVVHNYGFHKLEPMVRPSFQDLGVVPRAMQVVIQDLDLSKPFCMFIKAGTGQGKTIASLQALLGYASIVFAANNQTTANSIYKAVNQVIDTANPGCPQAVALAHANRRSVIESYQEYLMQDDPSSVDIIRSKFELQSENITDALTARYLVATVDQILMSIFNDGRCVYRLPALVQKAHIVDEVHSLDGRLHALLDVYLQILGKFKVPVVLLSATIPTPLMNSLVKSWAVGAGLDYKDVQLSSNDEIVLYRLNSSEPTIYPVSREATAQKVIPITFVPPGNAEAMRLMRDRLRHVERVTYMGPTARNVQSLYSAMAPQLLSSGITPICFTARFTPADRTRVEHLIESSLGVGAPNGPKIALFATSVCRESHNWSWDELISGPELMTSLVQAVGRTDRWARPSRVNAPSNLFIQRPFLTLDRNQNPTGLSLGDLDYIIGGGDAFGYRKFYALQTYFLLLSLGKMTLPFDAQQLVDRSFDLPADSVYPELMDSSWQQYWDQSLAFQRTVAAVEASTIRGLTMPVGFDLESTDAGYDLFGQFTKDKIDRIKHQTRLIFGSQSFYISNSADDINVSQPFPDAREIALKTVSISNQQNYAGAFADHIPSAWAKNKMLAGLPRLVVDQPIVVTGQDGKRLQIVYRRDIGLQIGQLQV